MLSLSEAISVLKSQPIVRYEELTHTTSDLGDALRMAIRALESERRDESSQEYFAECFFDKE